MRTNIYPAQGFATLAPVIIIGGLIMAITSGVALRARTQTRAGIYNVTSQQTLMRANACAELAIGKLQTVFGYGGNESISSNGIACDILPITGTGNYNRVITARATVKNVTKKIQVTITQISSPTVISSWKEIAN